MFPSSPVAVHARRIQLEAMSDAARSMICPGAIVSGSPTSLSRFKRPPLTHLPEREGSTSRPTLRSRLLPAATVIVGNRPRSMAMAPET